MASLLLDSAAAATAAAAVRPSCDEETFVRRIQTSEAPSFTASRGSKEKVCVMSITEKDDGESQAFIAFAAFVADAEGERDREEGEENFTFSRVNAWHSLRL